MRRANLVISLLSITVCLAAERSVWDGVYTKEQATRGAATYAQEPIVIWLAAPAGAQQGAKNGEWRFYGGDAGSTKYSPLDQINESNVSKLQVVWRWKAENFGPRADFNWEVTPVMAGGVLY